MKIKLLIFAMLIGLSASAQFKNRNQYGLQSQDGNTDSIRLVWSTVGGYSYLPTTKMLRSAISIKQNYISPNNIIGNYRINVNTLTARIEFTTDTNGSFLSNLYYIGSHSTSIVTNGGYGGVNDLYFKKSDGKVYLYNYTSLATVQNNASDYIYIGSLFNKLAGTGNVEGFDISVSLTNSLSNVYINNVKVTDAKSIAYKNAENAAKFYKKLNQGQSTIIDLQGDSKFYGLGNGSQQTALPTVPGNFTRAQQTISQSMQLLLNQAGVNVQVRNLGYPGDRSYEGVTRWANYFNENGYADISLSNYGTNEVLNTSGYPNPISIEDFKINLTKIYSNLILNGVYVISVGNVNLSQGSTNRDLAFYNSAMKSVAESLGIPYIDQNAIVNHLGGIWSDGVHLTYQAYGDIGFNLANYFLNNGFNNKSVSPSDVFYWYNQIGHNASAGNPGSQYTTAKGQSMFIAENGDLIIPLNLTVRAKAYIKVLNTAGNYTIYKTDENTETPLTFTPQNNNVPQIIDLGIIDEGRRNIRIHKNSGSYGWVDEVGFTLISDNFIQNNLSPNADKAPSVTALNTALGNYQTISNLSSTISASNTLYPNNNAIINYTTGNFVKQGGNSFGAAMVIGTNDAQDVKIKRNGIEMIQVTSTVAMPFGAQASVNNGGANDLVRNVDAGKKQVLAASGTGAATTISIAHGMTGVTSASWVSAIANNAASAGIQYVTVDATNVNIFYTVAPVSGTNNLLYSIEVKQ